MNPLGLSKVPKGSHTPKDSRVQFCRPMIYGPHIERFHKGQRSSQKVTLYIGSCFLINRPFIH